MSRKQETDRLRSSDSLPTRRRLLQLAGGTALGTVVTAGQASAARDTYPVVSVETDADTINELKQQAAVHDTTNRAAFITCALSDRRELYVATGVESLDDSPDTIYQITEGTGFAAYDLEWLQNHRLRYWHDGAIYERKVPPSHKRFTPEKIAEQKLPDSVQSNGGDA